MQEVRDAERQCHEQGDDDYEIAWDDVNDCKLGPVKVRLARQAGMEFFKNMQVYKSVPTQKCRDMTGKEPIKVRWVDTTKHDEASPKHRSRLVANNLKRTSDPDLYTATPPIDP